MKESFNLEDNYIYQEMIKWEVEKRFKQGLEQGLEQGKKEGLRYGIVSFVEIRFPDLVSLAKQQAEQAATSQQLQEVRDKLFMAHSDEEVKAVLLNEQA